MSNSNNIIAGMSLGGGKRENVFFCLLEFYPDQKRWFLKSLKQVQDEDVGNSDKAITGWIEEFDLKNMVVDFPLSGSQCDTCTLECPGTDRCLDPQVLKVREMILDLMEEDRKIYQQNPKRYEEERNEDNMIQYSRNRVNEQTDDHLLSKSFKRKLKKGFLPYWNRPLDMWVWRNYYDQLLHQFQISYDSFGNVSTMLLAKFNYLKKHMPKGLALHEADSKICLIELMRSRIISKNMLDMLSDIEQGIIGRLEIIKAVEKKLGVFIYDHDLETLSKNPKAFDSFLLALVGLCLLKNENVPLPQWAQVNGANFVVPNFSF